MSYSYGFRTVFTNMCTLAYLFVKIDDRMDERFGFTKYTSGPARLGWLLNMQPVNISARLFVFVVVVVCFQRKFIPQSAIKVMCASTMLFRTEKTEIMQRFFYFIETCISYSKA